MTTYVETVDQLEAMVKYPSVGRVSWVIICSLPSLQLSTDNLIYHPLQLLRVGVGDQVSVSTGVIDRISVARKNETYAVIRDEVLDMLAIINRHLSMLERDVLLCQDELIEAGFEGWARL